jgi:hypothetical protein
MDTAKLKITVEGCAFEAEGPPEIVQQQYEAFLKVISSLPAAKVEPKAVVENQQNANKNAYTGSDHVPLENLMHTSGRVVSLTALPATAEDTALLIMLGHKELRNNVAVTGQEIGDGLAQSGRPVGRVDRVMEKPIADSLVLKSGIKRSTRYRLTNLGLQKALGVAKDLNAALP